MNTFFAPISSKLIGQLNEYDRLYSCPKVPDPPNGRKVIIDSGTYGLYESGILYNEPLTIRLAQYHQEIVLPISDAYILAPPDVAKNPYKSIHLFKYYKSISNANIRPCFQFTNDKFNINQFIYQYKAYKSLVDFDFVFFTGSDMDKAATFNLNRYVDIMRMIRRYIPLECNIHVFSGGKSISHILGLTSIPYVSFDTTNYQYDAACANRMATKWGLGFSTDYITNCKAIINKINLLVSQANNKHAQWHTS